MSSNLFKPFDFNGKKLAHRVVLGSTTRMRANLAQEPTEIMHQFYEQRARVPGTLLFTEGTHISLAGGGYAVVPGIYSEGQVAAWKKITDAVHANGSYIYSQLLYEGRTADPTHLAKSGNVVTSPGNVPVEGGAQPKQLTKEDLEKLKGEYVAAAENAIKAGFDGVEVHSLNGYGMDTFLQSHSNNRTDEYGGSPENRARFPVEVIGAIAASIGQERVGIRVGPYSEFQGMTWGDDLPTYVELVKQLGSRFPKLSHLNVLEPRVFGDSDIEKNAPVDATKPLWEAWGTTRPFITSGGYDVEKGKKAADEHPTWLVSYSRLFTSNPDLPARFVTGTALTPYVRAAFYGGDGTNYSDFPFATDYKNAFKA